MPYIIGILIGLAAGPIIGVIAYTAVINWGPRIPLVSEETRAKILNLIPLYPKRGYAFLLYLLSGVMFGLMFPSLPDSFAVYAVTAFGCVLLSSLAVRGIAHLRHTNLEESVEDAIERRWNSKM